MHPDWVSEHKGHIWTLNAPVFPRGISALVVVMGGDEAAKYLWRKPISFLTEVSLSHSVPL